MIQLNLEGKEIEPAHQYIIDYITDKQIRKTPEEDSVQIFSQRLVEEYGYSKSQIQTHPQYRIKSSPSGDRRYPIDIAVFHNNNKTYSELYMVIECKQPTRNDGKEQLELYLNLPHAQIGIWFNGKEHLYLQKVYREDGSIEYHEIPSIPKKGQKIEDIGKYLRKN